MDSIFCAVCLDSYDTLTRRPVLGKCGHSLCFSCLEPIQQRASGSCPICVETYAFRETKFNFQMIELIEITLQKELQETAEAEEKAEMTKELGRLKSEMLELEEKQKSVEKSEATKKAEMAQEMDRLKAEATKKAEMTEELERLKSEMLEITRKQTVIETSELQKASQNAAKPTRYTSEELKKLNPKFSKHGKTLGIEQNTPTSSAFIDPVVELSPPAVHLPDCGCCSTVPFTVKGTKLYVNNMDRSITSKTFSALFQPYGKLRNANLALDYKGKSKGCGTVVYLNTNDAICAMKDLDKKLVGSKQISVKFIDEKSTLPLSEDGESLEHDDCEAVIPKKRSADVRSTVLGKSALSSGDQSTMYNEHDWRPVMTMDYACRGERIICGKIRRSETAPCDMFIKPLSNLSLKEIPPIIGDVVITSIGHLSNIMALTREYIGKVITEDLLVREANTTMEFRELTANDVSKALLAIASKCVHVDLLLKENGNQPVLIEDSPDWEVARDDIREAMIIALQHRNAMLRGPEIQKLFVPISICQLWRMRPSDTEILYERYKDIRVNLEKTGSKSVEAVIVIGNGSRGTVADCIPPNVFPGSKFVFVPPQFGTVSETTLDKARDGIREVMQRLEMTPAQIINMIPDVTTMSPFFANGSNALNRGFFTIDTFKMNQYVKALLENLKGRSVVWRGSTLVGIPASEEGTHQCFSSPGDYLPNGRGRGISSDRGFSRGRGRGRGVMHGTVNH